MSNHSGTTSRGEVIAVTWERHRRTQGLAAGLQLPLYELEYRGHRAMRYLQLTLRTMSLLIGARPRTVLVQNPSIVLALVALLLRPVLRYKLIVDAHNEAVQPFIHSRWPVPHIARLLLRRADLTIVTNSTLARAVEAQGGRAFVLPDRLPAVTVSATPKANRNGVFDVMVISTYAPDEPLDAIFAAAAKVGADFQFHVTGNDRKLSAEARARVPANVRLTGFLSEHDYWALMGACDVVLDLTEMPSCLVCGAYEALAFGRPMILSDDPAGRELFADVAVFADTSPDSIASALREVRSGCAILNASMESAKQQFHARWGRLAEELGRRF